MPATRVSRCALESGLAARLAGAGTGEPVLAVGRLPAFAIQGRSRGLAESLDDGGDALVVLDERPAVQILDPPGTALVALVRHVAAGGKRRGWQQAVAAPAWVQVLTANLVVLIHSCPPCRVGRKLAGPIARAAGDVGMCSAPDRPIFVRPQPLREMPPDSPHLSTGERVAAATPPPGARHVPVPRLPVMSSSWPPQPTAWRLRRTRGAVACKAGDRGPLTQPTSSE